MLIYPNAKEAILYDPATKMIINVAPISLGNGTDQTTSQAQQAQIGIRNASGNSSIAATISSQLQQAYPGVVISTKDHYLNNKECIRASRLPSSIFPLW